MDVNGWLVVWRCGILALSSVGLVLLLMDVRHRRQLGHRGRFYWEAMALFLAAYAVGSIMSLVRPEPDFSPVRGTIATVALIYFILSIIRVRRSSDDETPHGGLE